MRPHEQRLRNSVLDHYGRLCACCGVTESLEIDHIDGSGEDHRAMLYGRQTDSHAMYRWLIKSGFPEGFQTLCKRCNTSKARGKACRLHAQRGGELDCQVTTYPVGMSAQDNLSPHQFMAVADLMDSYSRDALGVQRNLAFNRGEDPRALSHGGTPNTRMRDLYERKAQHMVSGEGPDYTLLDEPIRNGSIDPVLLSKTSWGDDEIVEGHHRIVRAHQLGIERLPVSYDLGSQAHRHDWDD